MKTLTLDETWVECLKMWRWIVRQPCPRNVKALKVEWITAHGFAGISHACFFCEYSEYGRGWQGCVKGHCPAKLVDRKFTCACDPDYNYEEKPAAFLRKITALYKIYLAKKTA